MKYYYIILYCLEYHEILLNNFLIFLEESEILLYNCIFYERKNIILYNFLFYGRTLQLIGVGYTLYIVVSWGGNRIFKYQNF